MLSVVGYAFYGAKDSIEQVVILVADSWRTCKFLMYVDIYWFRWFQSFKQSPSCFMLTLGFIIHRYPISDIRYTPYIVSRIAHLWHRKTARVFLNSTRLTRYVIMRVLITGVPVQKTGYFFRLETMTRENNPTGYSIFVGPSCYGTKTQHKRNNDRISHRLWHTFSHLPHSVIVVLKYVTLTHIRG